MFPGRLFGWRAKVVLFSYVSWSSTSSCCIW